MTNPTKKYTPEEHKAMVIKNCPSILDVLNFTGVDNMCTIICKHGETRTTGWTAIKRKHCCRTGYFEQKRVVSNEDAIKKRLVSKHPHLDVSSAVFTGNTDKGYGTLAGVRCTIHNELFDSLTHATMTNCPVCRSEAQSHFMKTRPDPLHSYNTGVRSASYVSKQEADWLDSLGIPVRQKWLADVKYRVDGFDPDTNTVYLFHGRFWHGCPETYKPDDIHPFVKLPMSALYEKTIHYENKIKEAGYNLVVKWG